MLHVMTGVGRAGYTGRAVSWSALSGDERKRNTYWVSTSHASELPLTIDLVQQSIRSIRKALYQYRGRTRP